MAAALLAILLWIVALGMLLVPKSKSQQLPLKALSIIPGVLGWVILGAASFTVVSPGEVGVPIALGSVGTPLTPGIHLIAPWATVETLSTKTQSYTMSHVATEGQTQGNDSVIVQSKDNATVTIDSTVLYHVASSSARDIVKKYGTDYQDKIVRPTIRADVRDAATAFDATELGTTGRAQFELATTAAIEKGFQQYGLVLESVKVRDIGLPQTVIDSVNIKIKSAQDLLNLQIQLQQAQINADIQRTGAKATADAQQIVACGAHFETVDGKQAVTPNSKDKCDQTQLTPQYLQFVYIQTLQKIAESKSNSTIVIPFDQKLTPLLNVK